MTWKATSIRRHDREAVEIDVTVGLGPQADAAGDRLGQGVLEVGFAVERGFDLGAGDADLELVPLAARRRRVANPFHRRPPALLELPQHEIVFERVGTDRQVVAVGLEVEQYARRPDPFEPDFLYNKGYPCGALMKHSSKIGFCRNGQNRCQGVPRRIFRYLTSPAAADLGSRSYCARPRPASGRQARTYDSSST